MLSLQSIGGDVVTKFPRQLLYLSPLNIIAQSDTYSMHPSSCSSADSMKVAFWLIWKAKVNDCFDVRDVKATSYEICCQKKVYLTSLELLDVFEALLLGKVSLYFSCPELEYLEEYEHPVALNFLIKEDYDSLFKVLQDDIQQGGFSPNQIGISWDFLDFLIILSLLLLFLFGAISII